MTILTGDEARLKMFNGMEKVAKIVSSTIGPKGRNVVFAKGSGKPQITNDGVTVAKNIKVDDPIENIGASLIKDVSNKTNDNVGDGTTTATVLAYAMVKEGLREIRSGINAVEIKNGMKGAGESIVKYLSEIAKPVDTNDQIKQIATISAQDEVVGSIIAEAMEKAGTNGFVTVMDGQKAGLELEVTQGMKFERGFLSPYMVNDLEKNIAHYENVKVLITDRKITDIKHIAPLLEKIMQAGITNLVLIADDIESYAMQTLILNKMKGIFNTLAIRAPGIGDRRRESAKDLSVLTGATFLDDSLGFRFEDVTIDMLGTIKEITTTSDSTTIICDDRKEEIVNRVNEIRKSMINESDAFQMEKKEERIARLTAGVAVIKVGATTEVELKEKKLRIEDALNATKAAVAEGIVAGGGIALAEISEHQDTPSDDYTIGFNIVFRSLKYPLKAIVENSGKNGDVIIEKIKSSKKGSNYGYNAKEDTFGDMFEMGIIDPKKVTRVALENAISIASTFLTTDTVSYTEEEKPSQNGGGMMF